MCSIGRNLIWDQEYSSITLSTLPYVKTHDSYLYSPVIIIIELYEKQSENLMLLGVNENMFIWLIAITRDWKSHIFIKKKKIGYLNFTIYAILKSQLKYI